MTPPERQMNQGQTKSDWKATDRCPDCGTKLAHEGGCIICYGCGWGLCG